MRQATNISPKNQNGISYSTPGHGMVYSSEYMQNVYHAQRSPGRSCRFSSIRNNFIRFMFLLLPLSRPNRSLLDTWDLFLIPFLFAPSPRYHYEHWNHVSGPPFACAMALNWENILCHRHYIISLSK